MSHEPVEPRSHPAAAQAAELGHGKGVRRSDADFMFRRLRLFPRPSDRPQRLLDPQALAVKARFFDTLIVAPPAAPTSFAGTAITKDVLD
jgi:hypothetical protein